MQSGICLMLGLLVPLAPRIFELAKERGQSRRRFPCYGCCTKRAVTSNRMAQTRDATFSQPARLMLGVASVQEAAETRSHWGLASTSERVTIASPGDAG